MKKRGRRAVIFVFLFLLAAMSLFAEYFSNETSISNSEYEKYYNFYAKRLKQESGISVYTHFFLTEESGDNSDIVKGVDDKLNELFKLHLKKDKEKFIIILFSLNTNIVKTRSNFDANITKDAVINKIINDYFVTHFDYMNFNLDVNTGEITGKLSDQEVYNNKDYITLNIMLASLNLLEGISKNINIDLKINKKITNLLKERGSIETKIKNYVAKIE